MSYYCHRCDATTTLNEETHTCAQCGEGFVEFVDTADMDENDAINIVHQNPNAIITEFVFRGSPAIAINTESVDWPQLLRPFLENIFGPNGIPALINLPGNINDYARGQADFDNIVTQLLNNLENNGPPPASEEAIQAIPQVKITQEDVDKQLSCSVCFDAYNLDELVDKLPCSHMYHHSCIIDWLTRNGTCPVCRKTLNGTDSVSSDTH